METVKDLSVLECREAWKFPEPPSTKPPCFIYTKAVLIDSSGNYYYARTNERTTAEKLKLSSLRIHPIPDDHIYPQYNESVTRAPEAIIQSCYIKRQTQGLINYGNDGLTNDFKDMFMAEIEICEILARSPHPNIVRYLGCLIEQDGRIHGICLGRYEKTLKEVVEEKRLRINLKDCLEGIEKGIEHLHGLGLVHNDINPSNVMMDENNRSVIIDFDSCTAEGALRMKGGTAPWCILGVHESRKENDYHGLKEIEKWLIEHSQQSDRTYKS